MVSLKQWCEQNGEFGQQLMQEFVGELEDGTPIKIDEIAAKSNKKVYWKCNQGHKYTATLANRTINKTKCAQCAGKTIIKRKYKTDTLASKFPELAKEWHPTLNDTTPDKISYSSNTQRYWKCINCGYGTNGEWVTKPSRRTAKGYETGCPKCKYLYLDGKIHGIYKKFVDKGQNDLSTWCKNNDAWGELIQKEWTGITEDNEHIDIIDISFASTKKLLWICDKKHEWWASPHERTKKRRCPLCNTSQTSYPEQFIYHALKQIFPETENRYKALKNIYPQGIEFDIAIPIEIDGYKAVCIEYSSTFWHEGREEKDKFKKEICKQYNIRFIEIIEDANCTKVNEVYSSDYIRFRMQYYDRDSILEKIVAFILNTLKHDIIEVDLTEVKSNAIENSN